jgi:integrase/recombinase XerD
MELEMLYQQYSQLKRVAHRQKQVEIVHIRNTVILGLLIFQGIQSGELSKMEIGHIDLNTGKAYIPSTCQSSSRELELSQKQVIALHQYLNTTKALLKLKGEELIGGSIRNVIAHLMAEIQGLNPTITNALHIRGSVILNWLKIHPKRQVQYMAGHKYISSTEKYASQGIEDLQDALAKHHPFG